MGIAASSVTPMPMLLSLDVTMSNCLDAGFNGHYSGTLGVYPADKSAQHLLVSTPILALYRPPVHDLLVTMRR
jgi:hypothetical protein